MKLRNLTERHELNRERDAPRQRGDLLPVDEGQPGNRLCLLQDVPGRKPQQNTRKKGLDQVRQVPLDVSAWGYIPYPLAIFASGKLYTLEARALEGRLRTQLKTRVVRTQEVVVWLQNSCLAVR